MKGQIVATATYKELCVHIFILAFRVQKLQKTNVPIDIATSYRLINVLLKFNYKIFFILKYMNVKSTRFCMQASAWKIYSNLFFPAFFISLSVWICANTSLIHKWEERKAFSRVFWKYWYELWNISSHDFILVLHPGAVKELWWDARDFLSIISAFVQHWLC